MAAAQQASSHASSAMQRWLRRFHDALAAAALDSTPAEVMHGSRLFVGSVGAAVNHIALRAMQVTHVVTVAFGIEPELPRDVQGLRIDVPDSPDFDLRDAMKVAFPFVEEALSCPSARVLLHCLAGRSRSAALALAFLVMRRGVPLPVAVAHLAVVRAQALPNRGFRLQLIAMDNMLRRHQGLPPHAQALASPGESCPPPVPAPGPERDRRPATAALHAAASPVHARDAKPRPHAAPPPPGLAGASSRRAVLYLQDDSSLNSSPGGNACSQTTTTGWHATSRLHAQPLSEARELEAAVPALVGQRRRLPGPATDPARLGIPAAQPPEAQAPGRTRQLGHERDATGAISLAEAASRAERDVSMEQQPPANPTSTGASCNSGSTWRRPRAQRSFALSVTSALSSSCCASQSGPTINTSALGGSGFAGQIPRSESSAGRIQIPFVAAPPRHPASVDAVRAKRGRPDSPGAAAASGDSSHRRGVAPTWTGRVDVPAGRHSIAATFGETPTEAHAHNGLLADANAIRRRVAAACQPLLRLAYERCGVVGPAAGTQLALEAGAAGEGLPADRRAPPLQGDNDASADLPLARHNALR
uniref:Protein-serine/threonine phosphatase n=1 Tax=Cafeteria roenbergensis TaxID=33653 RepID=A0A7S0PFH5_CAFRO|mmetsp:Transcript_5524/g.23409  ORF Transcript_5524/g.23409 Transcript_5524/m.23409 type:complete len:590 (+) Transcript_5524:194-1963(+)